MKNYTTPEAEQLRIRSEKLLIETSQGVEQTADDPINSVKSGIANGGSTVSQLAGFQPAETNLP